MPICPFGMIPNRYSSPIAAPESMPNKSSVSSPKLPSPSGRVNRCVTRNALPNFGSLSDVGSATNVKSGSASLRAAGSSSWARAIEGVAMQSPQITGMVQRVSRRLTGTPVEER
jgi:hypothetical protein